MKKASGKKEKLDVFGIGNPIMDILLKVDDSLLKELGLKKGDTHFVDEKQLAALEEVIEKRFRFDDRIMIPGGSVANTTAAIINLGGKSCFCGKAGTDLHSEVYHEKLTDHGVVSRLLKHKGRTGQAITFITPDSERTFVVHLGVADRLKHHEILEKDILNAKHLHVSGYVLEAPETRKATIQAMEYAKKHNVKISLDLSEHNLVKRNLDIMKTIIRSYVDIVFANEKEAKAYTGKEPEKALHEIAKDAETAVVKIGKEGSIVKHKNKVHRIKCVDAKVIDTTGAGDVYAGAFLLGLSRGHSAEKAGKIASYAASKIVEIIGARLEHNLKDEIGKM